MMRLPRVLVLAAVAVAAPPAATDACGRGTIPRLRGGTNETVGLVRIQKTGSTALCALWDKQKKRLAAFDEWSHGDHHDWHQVRTGAGFYSAKQRRAPVDVVVVNLRDPVERVLSEYYFCVSRKNCVQQLQWDYAHRGTRDATAAFVTLLRARMLAHLNGTRSLGLKEFVNWPGNPAHERMSQYVSGLRYGQFWRGAALEDARRNLCDDRTVVLLSSDRPNASLALARAELGWALTRGDWTRRVEPGRKSKFVAAPDHLPPDPPRAAVDAELVAEIRERNPADAALYALAVAIVESRAALLEPAPPSAADAPAPT